MNKGMKSCLISVLVLVGLCVVGAAAAFFAKPCPPQGPWPMPPWCQRSANALLPAIPTITVRPFYPTPTETIMQFLPSRVDIYGRDYYEDPEDWVLNGTIYAFGPVVGTNIDWIHKLQSHGATAFSNISTWNSAMSRTPEELPQELKNSYLKGFDGEVLYEQGIVFLNILDPTYQDWLKRAIEGDIDGGTDGISIDEHQGTVQAVWSGEGPCDEYSLNGFRDFLKSKYSQDDLKLKGVTDIDAFNYCQYIVDNGYRELYRTHRDQVPFSSDYIHYLYSATDRVLVDLLDHARDYAGLRGRSLLFGANFDPLDRIDESGIFDMLDLFIFEHDWFPSWRNESGWYKFPAGSPISPNMKYAANRGKAAAAMYIIADAKEFMAQGKEAGTRLVNHQFAESYANRGYYMYFNLHDFLGLDFQADRSKLIPYYEFVRKYPEALLDLHQENSLAVVLPPHIDTETYFQKEWAFAVSATLSEANLQHDFIDLDQIGSYETVVASGVSWSDEDLDQLITYARNGGTVIAFDSRFASQDENYQIKSRPQLGGLRASGTHTLDKGSFIFFNEDMGWKLWAYQDPVEKARLVKSIEISVQADVAPEMVQVIPYTSGDGLVVQILNYDFQDGDFVDKKDFQVQIQVPDGSITDGETLTIVSPDLEGEKVVEFERAENVISFSVPSLYIWDVAILR